ncbi:MAG TPA: molybdopterin-binding protein [Pseudorhodoplanes sp.]|nr:molybdopterin-binding protein [Pseudorhodoplanes sp.]
MVSDHPQRIARLAPLGDVLAWIDANVRPVASSDVPSSQATGKALAADIAITKPIPSHPISLRDGYALKSEWTNDASPYAPALLPQVPPVVAVGIYLPAGMDCVAAPEHVVIKGESAEALAVVAPGDGVLPAGGDVAPNQLVLRAGQKLRAPVYAVLSAVNTEYVRIRAPRITVVTKDIRDHGAIIASASDMISSHINRSGGAAVANFSLEDAFARDIDAVISIGGTGSGSDDTFVTELRSAGKVAFHGIGLLPGETAAIGEANGKPVLLMPGRIDAALACWLLLGRRMFARLAGSTLDNATMPLKLTRKITSTIGIADVVLLKRDGGEAEPLASGTWPLQALMQADSYCVVPPESEGFPAGATVSASPLP